MTTPTTTTTETAGSSEGQYCAEESCLKKNPRTGSAARYPIPGWKCNLHGNTCLGCAFPLAEGEIGRCDECRMGSGMVTRHEYERMAPPPRMAGPREYEAPPSLELTARLIDLCADKCSSVEVDGVRLEFHAPPERRPRPVVDDLASITAQFSSEDPEDAKKREDDEEHDDMYAASGVGPPNLRELKGLERV